MDCAYSKIAVDLSLQVTSAVETAVFGRRRWWFTGGLFGGSLYNGNAKRTELQKRGKPAFAC
jgi:hypothetical protein